MDAVTTDTKSQEIAAVARLAALECRRCYARSARNKGVIAMVEGTITLVPVPSSPSRYRNILVAPSCPDCQGTGRRLSGLVKKCRARQHQQLNGIIPCSRGYCDGTGWIPVSPAEALHWLMGRPELMYVALHWDGLYGCWKVHMAKGPTPLLALAAAIEAQS